MPAVIDLPPTTDVVQESVAYDSMGEVGLSIFRHAALVAEHWEERTESHLNRNLFTDEEFDYSPVPLEVVSTVNVRYEFVGDLQPLPYDWDE